MGELKSQPFDYSVIYSNRKSVEINISPPDQVIIRVPKKMTHKQIDDLIHRKSKWIIKKLDEIHSVLEQKQEVNFIDGETIMYLGEKYKLSINENTHLKAIQIEIHKDYISINTPYIQQSEIKQAVIDWYKKQARKIVMERIEYYQQHIKIKPNYIRIKEQKKRWGSCSSKHNLNFNWKIIMAPIEVVDYLVVHEMSHLEYMNHSKMFWDKVQSILPDYKDRQKWLKTNGLLLNMS